MTTNAVIKFGDTTGGPRVRLTDRDGTGADLTGATVVLVVPGQPDIAVTVTDPAAGVVRIPRGTLAPPVGQVLVHMDYELQATYADGSVQTFPESGYERLTIWRDLDDQ